MSVESAKAFLEKIKEEWLAVVPKETEGELSDDDLGAPSGGHTHGVPGLCHYEKGATWIYKSGQPYNWCR